MCLFFLLLTMCRPLITLLRRVGVHSFLPLDLHVTYHQSCGVLLAILSVLHTICHLGNLEMNLIPDTANNPANYTTIQWLMSSDTTTLGTIRGQTLHSSITDHYCVLGHGYPTGVALVVVLGRR